jgi:O-antigen ligase/Tfp pilus assembly protein PilF
MYDVYQLPKAAALYVSVFLTLVAMLFFRGSETAGTTSIIAAIYFLYVTGRLCLTHNHPPFYYGLTLFSPVLFFTALHSGIKKNIFLDTINILFFASVIYAFYQFLHLKISRPYSFFGNPIFFAEFISVCAPLILFSTIFKQKTGWFSLLNLLLLFPSLILAGSRGAVISLIISALILGFFYIRAGIKLNLNPKIAVISLLLLFLPLLMPGFINTIRSDMLRASSLMGAHGPEIKDRLMLAQTSYDIFTASRLTGSGPGAVRQFHQLKQVEILSNNPSYSFINSSYSHNDYMQLLAETGIIGIALFISFIFSLAHGFEKASSFMEGEKLLYPASLFASIIFLCVESFFNFPLFSLPSSALLFLFSGLIAAEIEPYVKKMKLKPAVFKTCVIILLVPCVLYPLSQKPRALASNFYLKSALQTGALVNSSAAELYKKAVQLENDSFYCNYHYADYFAKSNQPVLALIMYDKILSYFPNSADIYYDKGIIYLVTKNYSQAVINFNRAIFYYPSFAPAHLGLYRAFMYLHDEKNGAIQLEKAVQLDSNILKNNYSGNILDFKEATFDIPVHK